MLSVPSHSKHKQEIQVICFSWVIMSLLSSLPFIIFCVPNRNFNELSCLGNQVMTSYGFMVGVNPRGYVFCMFLVYLSAIVYYCEHDWSHVCDD